MSRRRQLTDAERHERRRADRERLERAARALLTSDGWQRWVHVRASNGLGRYSLHNQLLIALQRPDAAYVCGFKAWIGLGYCVRRGEKAIKILAPVTVKVPDDENEDGNQRCVFFRAVSVFDRSQVAPLPEREPTPLEPPCQPLSGDSHKHLLPALAAHAATLAYRIAWQAIPGSAGGWCNRDAREIVIDTGLAPNAQVRALVHELAHAHGVGYQRYGREQAEVIVDTVTYIVCASAGLNVAGESVAYVAGWGEDGALEAVTEFAGVIDQIAKTLEAAIADDGPAPRDAADAAIEVPAPLPTVLPLVCPLEQTMRGMLAKPRGGLLLRVPDGAAGGLYVPSVAPGHSEHELTRKIRRSKLSREHDPEFADLLAATAARYFPDFKPDVVVSVPEKPGQEDRLRNIRHEVARRTGAAVGSVLRQTRVVEGYRRMTAGQRRASGEGRFAASDSARGKSVLLLDDVVTSGGQANDAIRALRAAGAVDLRFVAVTRATCAPGEPPRTG